MKITVQGYDFETTGVDPHKCEPCQVAVVDAVINPDGSYEVLAEFEAILKIAADTIPEGAERVHGISKERTELEGLEPSLIGRIGGYVLGYNNTRYDDIIAARYGAKITQSFDVFKLASKAKRLGFIKKASLGSVFEALVGESPDNAHDALADVHMTLKIIKPLMQLLELDSLGDVIRDMENEIKFVTMPFGKHKGTPVKDLPTSYVNWLRKEVALHGDLKEAIEMFHR